MSISVVPALITATGGIVAGLSVQIFLLFRARRRDREILYGELLDLMRHLAANERAIAAIQDGPKTAARHHFQMLELPSENVSISVSGTRFLHAFQISSMHRLALSARNYNFVVQDMVDNKSNRTVEFLASLRTRGRGLFVKCQKISDSVYARRSKKYCANASANVDRCRTHFGAGEFRFPYILSYELEDAPIISCPLARHIWKVGQTTERNIDHVPEKAFRPLFDRSN